MIARKFGNPAGNPGPPGLGQGALGPGISGQPCGQVTLNLLGPPREPPLSCQQGGSWDRGGSRGSGFSSWLEFSPGDHGLELGPLDPGSWEQGPQLARERSEGPWRSRGANPHIGGSQRPVSKGQWDTWWKGRSLNMATELGKRLMGLDSGIKFYGHRTWESRAGNPFWRTRGTSLWKTRLFFLHPTTRPSSRVRTHPEHHRGGGGGPFYAQK